MNKTKLKSYAPDARRAFIRAVTDRAHLFGLSETGTEPVEVKGDLAIIDGRPYPGKVAAQRSGLEARIAREGFGHVMEAVAYTWFNRFAALRYMEIHGYLDHGYRVLSHPSGGVIPEILEKAAEVELPGVKHDQVVSLKLDGNKDAELYRLLLVAQCNALADAMPFLFERIDDQTELLLPDNLLHSDSLIRRLVTEIDEEDWQKVEIVGWLYQFYISERKDEVIGKVVKSEDIPAATQLFTPNWIVQYLVQNSVGRLWSMANPASTLKSQWPYYIEPAKQRPEVQSQLDALIQTRVAEDGGSLNPETITILDPACGSGHILVVAYDVLKGMYLERGYQPRAIPRLILEKNLFGLEIDDRAAQLTAFAIMMKARADDRRLLDHPLKLNVLSFKESKSISLDEVTSHLARFGLQRSVLKALLDIFSYAKTYGSLIQVPAALSSQLKTMAQSLRQALFEGDMYARQAANDLVPLVSQALVLGMSFDAVIGNPPYIGNRAGMNDRLKAFADQFYQMARGDTFAMFIQRGLLASKTTGFVSMVTLDSWLTLVTYEAFRSELVSGSNIASMLHMPYEGKSPTAMGLNFGVVSFTLQRGVTPRAFGYFARQRYSDLSDDGAPISISRMKACGKAMPTSDFSEVPSSAIVYMLSDAGRRTLAGSQLLGSIAEAREGMATADNNRFVRWWFEVRHSEIHFDCQSTREATAGQRRWFPYIKGGEYRKWYGNNGLVVNWLNDGADIKANIDAKTGRVRSHNYNGDYGFRPGMTWTSMSSKGTGARLVPAGFMFDAKGPMLFGSAETVMQAAALMNSRVGEFFLAALSATKDFKIGQILALPLSANFGKTPEVQQLVSQLISLGRHDEGSKETSWAFCTNPLVKRRALGSGIWDAFRAHKEEQRQAIDCAQSLEQRVNAVFIEAYGLQEELAAQVPEDQITLGRADREWDSQSLVSYAVGCMMGRYSLDEPGLIYADAGNSGFDPSRYKTFTADADGIVPIIDEAWFADDAANRVREFLVAVWGTDMLEENLVWLAESLGTKGNETSLETVRRYLSTQFFKDHLHTYKKRPIYWLFSSGKLRAFECLVYLHRYNEATLSRMRAEYVTPLQGKLAARVAHLQDEVAAAPSTAARNKLQKQLETAKKKQAELAAFDDLLRHYADQRIRLDLDDGVKVNYGKFGDLLAEVKAVTGDAADD